MSEAHLHLQRSDMLKEVYDQNVDNTVDNSKRLDGLTLEEVRDHPGGGFPAPNYDSGWQATLFQVVKTFVHNLGTRDLLIQAYVKVGGGSWNPIECSDPVKGVIWLSNDNELSFYNLWAACDCRVFLWKW